MERNYVYKNGKYELLKTNIVSKKLLLNSNSAHLTKKCSEKLTKVQFAINGMLEFLNIFKFLIKIIFVFLLLLGFIYLYLRIPDKLNQVENKNLNDFGDFFQQDFYNCSNLRKEGLKSKYECDLIEIEKLNSFAKKRALFELEKKSFFSEKKEGKEKEKNFKNMEISGIDMIENFPDSTYYFDKEPFILRPNQNKILRGINYLLIFAFSLFLSVLVIYYILRVSSIKKIEKELKKFIDIENQNSDLMIIIVDSYKLLNLRLKENTGPSLMSINFTDANSEENDNILNDNIDLKKNISSSLQHSYYQNYYDIDDFNSSISLISPKKHLRYRND